MKHWGCDSIVDELRQTLSSVLVFPYGTSVHGTFPHSTY